ncbi:Uncharacterized protein FKW44_014130 [Caligus rogercresseyi]|uniref:Uncharacterized protein n=1 Tax=Caligus rogercresseyi TaxID=217165 RepID=A0A7T8JZQ1_CALRO|nr:Uncharacterized protein FKW44_014130 [Caligus rogercresseyi]
MDLGWNSLQHIKVGPGLLLKEFGRFLASKLLATLKPRSQSPDFAVWGFLERETNSTPHPNVDSLKAFIPAA